MAVVKSNMKQLELLARQMRAEAEGDGELGMHMIENVGVNRVRAACLDFRDIRTLEEIVFQSPGGFVATKKSYFYQFAREQDKSLIQRVFNGERFHPSTRSLLFLEPPGEYQAQWNMDSYKAHCSLSPSTADCPKI